MLPASDCEQEGNPAWFNQIKKHKAHWNLGKTIFLYEGLGKDGGNAGIGKLLQDMLQGMVKYTADDRIEASEGVQKMNVITALHETSKKMRQSVAV